MTRSHDLTEKLAAQVAAGELAPGSSLPSIRGLAATEGLAPATVQRAYQALGDAGVVRGAPRRGVIVTAEGELAARRLLNHGASFRLAGSDDPALAVLLAHTRDSVIPVLSTGSVGGLTALWRGDAEGAALHLQHRDGSYNVPFARALLAGRDPVLVHLWRREQGLIVPSGNPQGLVDASALLRARVARRARGTGTRALMDRLVLEAGGEPEAVTGPEVGPHLDVAVAVATGEADVGLGLRSAAITLGLDFVPLVSEPFEIATTRARTGGLAPLLTTLAEPRTLRRVEALGGYDLSRAGEIEPVG